MTKILYQDSIRSDDTLNQLISLSDHRLGNLATRSVKWLLSSTAQVIGLTSLDVICGIGMMSLKEAAVVINKHTLVCLPNIDFSFVHNMPETALKIMSYGINNGVLLPCKLLHNTLDAVLSVIPLEMKDYLTVYDNINLLKHISRAAPEEIYFRYLIQQVALPAFASLMPDSIGKIINHKITRITFTSFLFALSHHLYWESGVLFVNVFNGGLLYGTLAESTKSLKLPILVHALSNIGASIIHRHYITYQSQCDFIETSH